ncbi:MAG: alpha/beta fold hydrolase, partial [Pseudomonadota bacterium]
MFGISSWTRIVAGLTISLSAATAVSADVIEDNAARFGLMESVANMSLSPDGTHVVYLDRSKSQTAAVVANVDTGEAKAIMSDSPDNRLANCTWLNDERLYCTSQAEVELVGGKDFGFSRSFAVDRNGGNVKVLGQRSSRQQIRVNQNSGGILDLLPNDPDHVLMEVDLIPEVAIGTRIGQRADGLSVQKVNVDSNRMRGVQRPISSASSYYTDGRGNVTGYRLISSAIDERGMPTYSLRVRSPKGGEWQEIAAGNADADWVSIEGYSEDGTQLYTLRPYQGRQALFVEPSSGTGTPSLVYAHDRVDLNGVITFGRWDRPVAVSYSDGYTRHDFFDAELKALDDSLTAALDMPVTLIEDSWDGNRILLHASSDQHPGSYYVFDRAAKRVIKMSDERPMLASMDLAEVEPVQYQAADGTRIPAYLTLPPSAGAEAKNLPFVIMPHGGPSARDYWGFDFLPQYLASIGYAVLQPNYRGSTGYGTEWEGENAMRNWRQAISDVNDAARSMIREGVADPESMTILGWSYGGYSALQGGVMDPDLYRAIVAIAPVTDLPKLRDAYRWTTAYHAASRQIGGGANAAEGSPARRAKEIDAPVMIFFG